MRAIRYGFPVLLLLVLGACVPQAATQTKTTPTAIFNVDALVRSRQLPAVDLHLRYAERTADELALHVAFYNNGSSDLAYVSGIAPRAARLAGATPQTPVTLSPSLDTSIAPDNSWLVGGATNGTLTFAGVAGTAFTLFFPGFPPIPFRLDTPLREAPEAAAPAAGSFSYDFEAPSDRFPGLVLRVERATLDANQLDLALSFINRGARPLQLRAGPRPKDAALLDGRWSQYRPAAIDPALAAGIGGDNGVLPVGEANSGVLRFPRPAAGDRLLLKFPGFPLLRISLEPSGEAELATVYDLPPSVEPHPALAVPATSPLAAGPQKASRPADVLARLNQAWKTHDRAGYLGVFTEAARAEQAALFDRLLALPLADLTLTPAAGSGTLQGDDLRGFPATWAYRVQDVDPSNLFSHAVAVDFRRVGDRWQIARIGGDQPFWATGPVEVERAGSFWVFYRPGLKPEVPAIEQESATAIANLEQSLPGRVTAANVLFVTETAQEFAALTGRDPQRFLGVALSRWRIQRDALQIGNAALYINGAAFRADPRYNRQQTITHELTHLALTKETMPWTPLWLVEGMALEVSHDPQTETMRALVRSARAQKLNLRELTAKRTFSEPDSEQTASDYAYSAYLARYLAATYGFDRLLDFYVSFADIPLADIRADLPAAQPALYETMGELAANLMSARLQDAFGIDMNTLERDFKQWLQQQF